MSAPNLMTLTKRTSLMFMARTSLLVRDSRRGTR
jgi:hypothetical protein